VLIMASQAPASTSVSPEEYLAYDRQSDTRNEYIDGRIIEIAAVSRAHSAIVANLILALGTQLRGGPCTVFSPGLRVKTPRAGKRSGYLSPDVAVTCGEPRVEDAEQDTLLNPTVLVEVLSPSTADYDHGTKWEHYRQLPSLQDYLLVAQEEVRVERYARQGERFWIFSEATELSDRLEIQAIGCTLAVSDIYDRVLR
jgi:Uma2 family endonuclease